MAETVLSRERNALPQTAYGLQDFRRWLSNLGGRARVPPQPQFLIRAIATPRQEQITVALH